MSKGLFSKEGLLVPDFLFKDGLFYAFSLSNVLPTLLEDAVHLRSKDPRIRRWDAPRIHPSSYLDFFVGQSVEWVVFRKVRCVIELCMGGHVFVYIVCLDLE